MKEIFEILNQSKKANQIALDFTNRVPFNAIAIVTNNQDPEGRRRVKVALPSNPALESEWLTRIVSTPHRDAPLPTLGQTVLVMYIDGIETKGCYLSIHNDTNPSRTKGDTIKDLSEEIPGSRDVIVKQDDSLAVEGKITLTG